MFVYTSVLATPKVLTSYLLCFLVLFWDEPTTAHGQ